MVTYLNTTSTSLMRLIGILALLLVAGGQAYAAQLIDPTRPPATVDKPQENDIPRASTGPILQSILISPTRTIAIISGETVMVGDRIGDAQVVKITEGEVLLRRAQKTHTLKLFPDIEKKPASARSRNNLSR